MRKGNLSSALREPRSDSSGHLGDLYQIFVNEGKNGQRMKENKITHRSNFTLLHGKTC